MPLYQYKCQQCGHAAEEFQKITSDPLPFCPECQAPTYNRVPSVVHTDLREFHKPIEMFSVACNSLDQIRKIQKECPGVEISDDPSSDLYGVPVAKNRAEKKAVLKATGFEESN